MGQGTGKDAAQEATAAAAAAEEDVKPRNSAASDVKSTKSTASSMKPRTSLVDTESLRATQGAISVTGRYTDDKELTSFYTLDSKVVGSGMSGPVQLATCQHDGRKVAVKSFKKNGLSEKKRAELKSEVEIYLKLDHPHVARLERVFETEEEIHLVMEYMAGGELYDRLSESKKYTEEDAAKTAYMMLLAVGYLHAHQIAHRDLKLENFLYEAKTGEFKDHLKLIDFGFAKFWDHSTKMSQACGSVHYVAPEVLKHAYTEKADIWSLGIITYMLLTGSPPFFGSDDEVLRKIKAGQPHWSSRFLKLSSGAQQFVRRLIVLDPELRYSADAALNDPWILSREKEATPLDCDTLQSLRAFGQVSSFKRAVLSMMAWSLDTEDRAELREMFLSMDKEKRGTVTLAEMKELLEQHFQIDHAEAERIFRSIDKNNDNEIAYSEFLAAACIGRVHVHEDLLRKTFSKFDQDSTGKVSLENLEAILGEDFEGVKVGELIKQVDANNDGSIDYEEFINFFHKHDAAELAALDKCICDQGLQRSVTEKMCQVVERLARAQTTSFATCEDATPAAASPSAATPRPLVRRRDKAATFHMGAQPAQELAPEAA